MVWYSHLSQNFPQFIVIHTVKCFGIVNKAEIDVFLKLSCFFKDPADVGNLISGSSAFSKTSLKIKVFNIYLVLPVIFVSGVNQQYTWPMTYARHFLHSYTRGSCPDKYQPARLLKRNFRRWGCLTGSRVSEYRHDLWMQTWPSRWVDVPLKVSRHWILSQMTIKTLGPHHEVPEIWFCPKPFCIDKYAHRYFRQDQIQEAFGMDQIPYECFR